MIDEKKTSYKGLAKAALLKLQCEFICRLPVWSYIRYLSDALLVLCSSNNEPLYHSNKHGPVAMPVIWLNFQMSQIIMTDWFICK